MHFISKSFDKLLYPAHSTDQEDILWKYTLKFPNQYIQ